MNILVTGGAGFIGANFIQYMMNKYSQYKIICLDYLTYASNINNLKNLTANDNFKFIYGDICDRVLLQDVFVSNDIDVVVNFAAESHVDNSIEDPDIFYKTNVMGVVNLLNMCRRFHVKFHQVSTDEVYGDLPIDRKDLLFNESSIIKPSSPYSSSKASADMIVQAYNRTYGLYTTISRCSNNYGRFQFEEKFIPKIIKCCINNKDIPVYGRGLNVRDWLFVDDHCRAIDLIIHKGKSGEIYNIGGNNEISNIDLVKMICEHLNHPTKRISYVKDRAGHDLRYAIDSTKIRTELDWEPLTEFDKGLITTINYYVGIYSNEI